MAALDTSLYTGKAIHLEKQHNDCAGYQCSAKFHGKVVAISREIVGIGQMNCSVELCRIDGQEEPLAHFAFTS